MLRNHLIAVAIIMTIVACSSDDDDGALVDGGATGGTGAVGGTSSSGGTSSGGTSSGGTSSGGTGGGTGTSDRCPAYCQKLDAAMCPGAGTLEGCQLTCKALASSDTCNTVATTFFDCVDAGTVSCNGQGDPVVMGCELQFLAALDCSVKANPNPAIESKCGSYCDKLLGAMCPSGASTRDECVNNCLFNGATGTGCDDEWEGYLDCATPASWSCVLGFPAPAMCGTPFGAWGMCLNQAGMGG